MATQFILKIGPTSTKTVIYRNSVDVMLSSIIVLINNANTLYFHNLCVQCRYGQSLNEDTVLREIRTYVPSLLACADKYFATNDKAAKNQR